jgi:hypothetical protein
MKNFDEKEKQIQEICDRVRNSDFFDAELKIAYYDIIKLVREAYYEGHDDGVAKVAEIQAKNQELINNLFKK